MRVTPVPKRRSSIHVQLDRVLRKTNAIQQLRQWKQTEATLHSGRTVWMLQVGTERHAAAHMLRHVGMISS